MPVEADVNPKVVAVLAFGQQPEAVGPDPLGDELAAALVAGLEATRTGTAAVGRARLEQRA
jgi:hypothetical protein